MISNSISILIPTHNRRELLTQTLDSLAAVERPPGCSVEAIVIANGCTDGTESMVGERAGSFPVSLRCVPEHVLGLNVARHRGVIESSGNIIALLDDDVLVDPQWLAGLLEAFARPEADVVGGRVRLWWRDVARPDWISREVESLLSRADLGDQVIELHRPGQLVGANFAFRRSVYERIGAFKPGLDRTGAQLLAGGEHEFVQRAMDNGLRVFHAPRAAVLHYVHPKRIEDEYLRKVAYGRGQSRILMMPRFGPLIALRMFGGRLWQWLIHRTGEALSKGMKARMRHRVMRFAAQGALRAAWKRITTDEHR